MERREGFPDVFRHPRAADRPLGVMFITFIINTLYVYKRGRIRLFAYFAGDDSVPDRCYASVVRVFFFFFFTRISAPGFNDTRTYPSGFVFHHAATTLEIETQSRLEPLFFFFVSTVRIYNSIFFNFKNL